VDLLLGKEGKDGFATAVSISDAKLLFFPVKSSKGIFALVTCPMAVKRFLQDCKVMGVNMNGSMDLLQLNDNKALVTNESTLCFEMQKEKKVLLEEFVFDCMAKEDFHCFLTKLKETFPEDSFLKGNILSHGMMVSDDDFEYFVTQSTEVVTRIRIDPESGTASGQALFTEEYLPPESLLYSMLFFSNTKHAQQSIGRSEENKESYERSERQDTDKAIAEAIESAEQVKDKFKDLLPEILQVGGDMTLGKGLFLTKLWE
jgi:CRISPR-associated protein Cmr4